MSVDASRDARQALIAEMWAKARYEATQLNPASAQAVEFFNSRNSAEPEDTNHRISAISAWQLAKLNALKDTGSTIARLRDSLTANSNLHEHYKTQEAVGIKIQDADAPKLRRNSTDYSSVIQNLNRFILEATQKRDALLGLPDSPFGFQ